MAEDAMLSEVRFTSYRESVVQALNAIHAADRISNETAVLIKPNLVTNTPHPVTTSAECCAVIIDYIRQHSKASIVIAEGCGHPQWKTSELFISLGYALLSKEKGIGLIDLNTASLKTVANSECTLFPQMHLPKILFSHFIISVPVLKAHSISDMTGTMKNMMGVLPPAHYGYSYGSWKKAVFHEQIHQSIVELNHYRSPDLTVMDAVTGLADYHLGGPHCDPPINRILAGWDSLEVDRTAAALLGMEWQTVPHLIDPTW